MWSVSSRAAIVANCQLVSRLKATLERLQRLTEVFSEMLLELLTPTATALGQALGVAPHTIQTFTEAEIRAHVVFQARHICVGGSVRSNMHRPWQLLGCGSSFCGALGM